MMRWGAQVVGDRSEQGAETLRREGRQRDEKGRGLTFDGAGEADYIIINEE